MGFKEDRLVLEAPGMEQCLVSRDMVYKSVEGTDLRLDVYFPANRDSASRQPAVIFCHGEAPWEVLQSAKDWGQYAGWGRLAAAHGFVGITFTRRSSDGFSQLDLAARDIEDLFTYVRMHGDELGVDTGNLGLWVCSAGAPACLPTVWKESALRFRSIATLYPLMNLEHIQELRGHLAQSTITEYSPISALGHGSSESFPPLMIVRAGLDSVVFNQSIDDFMLAAMLGNLDISVVNHKTGQHAFDIRDDNRTSRAIIAQVMRFFQEHAGLSPATNTDQ